MTQFLLTGESEYCECGHSIFDHEENYNIPMCTSPLMSTSAFYAQCLSLVSGSKCKCNRCLSRCKCNQFTPYDRLEEYSREYLTTTPEKVPFETL
jgi:hypothetical protein